MKERIYGYCRISTMKQNIERQIANIKEQYPDATIITEAYTGTKVDRPNFNKLLKNVRPGDTIVFDEVSRMSRNAEEGFALYRELFEKGISLVFLKQPMINTSVYRDALNKHIDTGTIETGKDYVDKYINGSFKLLDELLVDIQREQIELAFSTAQAEVDFLHKRTAEGVRRAQAEGKQVGRKAGAIVTTKKGQQAKEIILKHSKSFNGTLSDTEVQKLAGISRNSYYKYKRELQEA